MSIIGSNILAGSSGQGGAYEIEQSLRFDGNAYLNRTPASAGNRKTFTYSFWIKRAKLGAYQRVLGLYTGASFDGSLRVCNDTDSIGFESYVGSLQASLATSSKYRDPSAWMHVVYSVDTTQVTASDRVKIYVNGQQVTSFSTATYPSQNADLAFNNNSAHYIGQSGFPSEYLDAYLAEFNFIDGTALDPTDFGEYDDNGVWRPIAYTGSYGTNGFYLKFESSGIGTDSSGNGNNFTPSGFTTSGTGTDVMSDTPTNNHCTFNPLNRESTLSNGNLNATMPGRCSGTISVTSGKWYWECKYNAGNGFALGLGIADVDAVYPAEAFQYGVIYYGQDGSKYVLGTNSSYSSAYSGGHFGIALDLDSAQNTIEFFLNGSSKGTINISDGRNWTPIVQGGSASTSGSWDMYIDENTWTYTPPTGFKALNTANLPEPTIKDGSSYFDTVIWTGTGSNITIPLGFNADLVWAKRRQADDHVLNDSIRGEDKNLTSNSTAAEFTSNYGLNFISTGNSIQLEGTGYFGGVGGGSPSFVAWCWDAGGTGSSNTAGSITSTVSANASAGFSIVTYTGIAGDNISATVGHGLGVAPNLIIIKNRDWASSAAAWQTYHSSLPSTGTSPVRLSQSLSLDTTNAASGNDFKDLMNNTLPTSTVFSVSSFDGVSVANRYRTYGRADKYVAYCFSEVAGYSKFGSYVGNGSSDGPFVYCGFRPAFVLTKDITAHNWETTDNARDPYNVANKRLFPSNSNAESSSVNTFDFLSNGFKVRGTHGGNNVSGNIHIFAAFAEHPFGGSGISPATAR